MENSLRLFTVPARQKCRLAVVAIILVLMIPFWVYQPAAGESGNTEETEPSSQKLSLERLWRWESVQLHHI